MTSTSFLTLYPEFSPVDAGQLQGMLDEVATGLDPSVYGPRWDAAHGALTAHQLFISPAGLSIRGDSTETDTSDYFEKFKRIRREVTIGFLVTT